MPIDWFNTLCDSLRLFPHDSSKHFRSSVRLFHPDPYRDYSQFDIETSSEYSRFTYMFKTLKIIRPGVKLFETHYGVSKLSVGYAKLLKDYSRSDWHVLRIFCVSLRLSERDSSSLVQHLSTFADANLMSFKTRYSFSKLVYETFKHVLGSSQIVKRLK